MVQGETWKNISAVTVIAAACQKLRKNRLSSLPMGPPLLTSSEAQVDTGIPKNRH